MLIALSMAISDASALQSPVPATPIELSELGANGSVSIEANSFAQELSLIHI